MRSVRTAVSTSDRFGRASGSNLGIEGNPDGEIMDRPDVIE
jgi:hypothetical protein